MEFPTQPGGGIQKFQFATDEPTGQLLEENCSLLMLPVPAKEPAQARSAILRAGLCVGVLLSAILLIAFAMASDASGTGWPRLGVGTVAQRHLVEAQAATCSWPSCVPKCLPCEHAVLGKCAWTVLNLGKHCPASVGPVDCLLGTCFCGNGFCPTGVALKSASDVAQSSSNSSLSRVASRCEPKTCLSGTKPPAHEPSIWARFFSFVCGSRNVPEDVIAKLVNGSVTGMLFHGDDPWFAVALCIPAVVLLCVGIAVSLEMLVRIECHESKQLKEIMADHMRVEAASIAPSGQIEAFTILDITGAVQTLQVEYSERQMVDKRIDGFMVDNGLSPEDWVHPMFDKDSKMLWELPDDREQWPVTVFFTPADCEMTIARPSPCPMMSLAVSTLVLCLMLLVLRAYQDLQGTLSIIDANLDRAHADAVVVARQGGPINFTAQQFGDILTNLNASCSKSLLLSPFIFSLENSTAPIVHRYQDLARDLGAKLASGPTILKQVQDSFDAHRLWFTWGPLLPAALISLLCFGMVLEAVAVELCDSSTIAMEVDVSLRIATVLFAIVIIVVTIVGASELWVANFLSLVCNDADANVLQGVQSAAGPGGLGHNVSLHYIAGDGYNPLVEMLHSADVMIFDIVKEYGAISGMLKVLGSVARCPVTKFLHVDSLVASARRLLSDVTPLLDNSKVYPYYDSIVRKGMCGTVISAIGWILLAQLMIGLVCFPLCVWFTHKFLTRWAIWEWAKEHAADTGVDTSGPDGPGYSRLSRSELEEDKSPVTSDAESFDDTVSEEFLPPRGLPRVVNRGEFEQLPQWKKDAAKSKLRTIWQ